MVNLKSVTVTHKNGTTALKRVSLRIDDGEFVLINGHSGAGKSTIVRLLTAEDVPTSGEVVIDGVNTKNLTHRQIPKFRRRLGVVFQDFRLIPTMNVFDNIAFAMRAVGRGRKEIKKRVAAVMEIVGLTGKEKSLPTQLSGGEQQRVALARAIVNNPKMIIADEPTGNIDPKMSAEVMDMFSLINQTGITVIVVTHEQAFVDTLDARVITLDHGNILNDTAHPEVAEELRLRRAAQNGDSEEEDEYEEEVVSEKKAVSEKEPVSEIPASVAEVSAPVQPEPAQPELTVVLPKAENTEEQNMAESEQIAVEAVETVSEETSETVEEVSLTEKNVEQKAEEFLASIGIDTEKIRTEQPIEIFEKESVEIDETAADGTAEELKSEEEAEQR